MQTTSALHTAENDATVTNQTVNIFFVYSPLHYVMALNILKYFTNGQKNCLFYIKDHIRDMVISDNNFKIIDFLPWPRFYPESCIAGRIKRTKINLQRVAKECNGFNFIRLHAPVIDTEAINFHIRYLQNKYPKSELTVRLFPDGVLNIQKHPLGKIKEIFQHAKRLQRFICPDLDYYTFHGDRTGSESDIVDRIYVLPRFNHEYDQSKVCMLPAIKSHSPLRSSSRRALVIGQPLVQDRRMDAATMDRVRAGIRNLLESLDFKTIDFKAHPREHDLGASIYSPGYCQLRFDEPLEIFLANNLYDVVIGVYSTALVTARLILPSECRIISYGLDSVSYYGGEVSKDKIENTFRQLEIEIYPTR